MQSKIKIGFIGAGKVGTSLGKYLKESGLLIEGYYSRTYKNAEEAAAFTGSSAYSDMNTLIEKSDVIFITVNDDSIAKVCSETAAQFESLAGKTFCHTSGVHSSNVLTDLKKLGAETCSIHMLLAVNDKYESFKDFTEAFFTAEGDCERVCKILGLCGNEYKIISSENKIRYHAAAVFASNFVVALSHIACGMLDTCGFSETEALRALTPLMLNNIKNITNVGPQKALTGPVQRGDFETIRKHLSCFGDSSEDTLAKEIYKDLTNALLLQTNQKATLE